MLLTDVIKELTTTLSEIGNCEVELQEKDTSCHSQIFFVVETNKHDNPILKIRSWPY